MTRKKFQNRIEIIEKCNSLGILPNDDAELIDAIADEIVKRSKEEL